jgi:hypothetical protein
MGGPLDSDNAVSEGTRPAVAHIFRHLRLLPTLSAGSLLAACTGAGPDDSSLLSGATRGPAILAFYGDTTTLQLAASIRIGEVTSVRFTSFGGGCILHDTTEVTVSGLAAEVRPYRRQLPANTVCTAELRIDQNVAELRFAEPGHARVRIVGLARPGDRPFVVTRDLLVTP